MRMAAQVHSSGCGRQSDGFWKLESLSLTTSKFTRAVIGDPVSCGALCLEASKKRLLGCLVQLSRVCSEQFWSMRNMMELYSTAALPSNLCVFRYLESDVMKQFA